MTFQIPIVWPLVLLEPITAIAYPLSEVLFKRFSASSSGIVIISKLKATTMADFIRCQAKMVCIWRCQTSNNRMSREPCVWPRLQPNVTTAWTCERFQFHCLVNVKNYACPYPVPSSCTPSSVPTVLATQAVNALQTSRIGTFTDIPPELAAFLLRSRSLSGGFSAMSLLLLLSDSPMSAQGLRRQPTRLQQARLAIVERTRLSLAMQCRRQCY